jgi:hypothetical protein
MFLENTNVLHPTKANKRQVGTTHALDACLYLMTGPRPGEVCICIVAR